MERTRAIETARAILDSSHSHADAVALALHVLDLDVTKSYEDAFSPSASSSGGGASPAAPAIAPVSTQSDAASSARNLGGPSGHLFSKEAETSRDIGKTETNAATIPTVYPTTGMGWQDEKIAAWLECHAKGYEHGGHFDTAKTLRKKAMQIRRREYLEEEKQTTGVPPKGA